MSWSTAWSVAVSYALSRLPPLAAAPATILLLAAVEVALALLPADDDALLSAVFVLYNVSSRTAPALFWSWVSHMHRAQPRDALAGVRSPSRDESLLRAASLLFLRGARSRLGVEEYCVHSTPDSQIANSHCRPTR